MCGAFIASLSLAALMLAANETFAETRTTLTGGFNPRHSIGPRVAQSMVHHRTNDVGALWFEGGFFDGSSNGEPMVVRLTFVLRSFDEYLFRLFFVHIADRQLC
jgi:hypothetical protein